MDKAEKRLRNRMAVNAYRERNKHNKKLIARRRKKQRAYYNSKKDDPDFKRRESVRKKLDREFRKDDFKYQDKQRTYSSRYWEKNKDNSEFRKKAKESNTRSYLKHKKKRIAGQRKYREKNIGIALYRSAKHRAKNEGIVFKLKPEDVTVPKICPVLGIELCINRGCAKENSPSLDRIKPGNGYVRGNVAVISYKANTIKNNGTLDEIRKVALWLENLGVYG